MVPPSPRHNLPFTKGPTMFVLLAILVLIALVSAAAVVVDVQKDGYRRLPERKLVRSF